MKKNLTAKEKECFYRTVISCLPQLTREQVLFYSKNTKVLKSKLTELSLLPSEEKKIAENIAYIGNQEVRDINRFVGNAKNFAKK